MVQGQARVAKSREELRRAWEALPEEEVRISTGVVCECELVMVDLRHFRIFCWLTAIVMELSAREQQTDGASKHNGASRVGGGGVQSWWQCHGWVERAIFLAAAGRVGSVTGDGLHLVLVVLERRGELRERRARAQLRCCRSRIRVGVSRRALESTRGGDAPRATENSRFWQ